LRTLKDPLLGGARLTPTNTRVLPCQIWSFLVKRYERSYGDPLEELVP